jgi:hypothetical protein
VEWNVSGGGIMSVLANLSATPVTASPVVGRELWREGDTGTAWSVRWAIEE